MSSIHLLIHPSIHPSIHLFIYQLTPFDPSNQLSNYLQPRLVLNVINFPCVETTANFINETNKTLLTFSSLLIVHKEYSCSSKLQPSLGFYFSEKIHGSEFLKFPGKLRFFPHCFPTRKKRDFSDNFRVGTRNSGGNPKPR